MNEYDFDSLKNDLIDYFGTAAVVVSFLALDDITKIKKASNEELLLIAKKSGFNLNKYIINSNINAEKRKQ